MGDKFFRGQSALEYMMTYGWAILVVIIIGVVVWQTGLLNLGENVTPGKRGFSQISPSDWRLKTDGSFKVIIQNDAGMILNILDSNVTFAAGGSGTCSLSTVMPINDFRPAAITTLEFTGCPMTANPKDYYRMDLTIKYGNPASELTHISRGILWGPVE